MEAQSVVLQSVSDDAAPVLGGNLVVDGKGIAVSETTAHIVGTAGKTTYKGIGANLTAVSAATLQTYPVSASAPNPDDILRWNGSAWVPVSIPAGITSHGDLSGLGDDNHTQYSLADGTRWTTTPTVNRAVVSDASGYLVVSSVTSTELEYLSGATSSVQTQLDGKQAYRAELTALDAVTYSVASAATVDLALATSDSVTITGSTGPITSFGTVAAGRKFFITFASTPTITHHVPEIISPTAASITAVSGDTMIVESSGGNTWKILSYAGASVRATSITASGLTSGRVPYVTTGGLLTDSSNNTFNGTTQTIVVATGTLGLSVRLAGDAGVSTAPYYLHLNSVIGTTHIASYHKADTTALGLIFGYGRNTALTLVADTYTTTGRHAHFRPAFTPSSGTQNFVGTEFGPTINGTSAGYATAVAIAPVTNVLTGGTKRLLDVGTTSTSYASGFTSVFCVTSAGVGVGVQAPSTSALLQVDSTTKGFLPPRMTTTERDLIGSPAAGLVIHNTTTTRLEEYNGAAWVVAGLVTLTELGVTASAAELNYVDGVTSAIQTQLDNKYPSATCVVRHSDGSSTAYNALTDTDAARGTALLAAIAAAASGEVVVCESPGAYDATPTVKSGVRIVATPGASLAAGFQCVGFVDPVPLTAVGAFTAGNDNTNSSNAGACFGQSNTMSAETGLCFGQGNTVSANYATGGGSGNTCSDEFAFAFGSSNVVSANSGTTFGGGNTVTGVYGLATGYGVTSYLRGQQSHGAVGPLLGQGSRLVLHNVTTNATPALLFLDEDHSAKAVIPTNGIWGVEVSLIGTTTGHTNTAFYKLNCLVTNTAGTVAIVGSVLKTIVAETDAAWDATLLANDTDNSLDVQVTGAAATSINWVATMYLVEYLV